MLKSKVSSPAPSQWETLTDSVEAFKKRGIHMDIVGLEGDGKSSLAMTLAHIGPIAYINIDQSVDRAKRPKIKDIKSRVKIHTISYAAHPDADEMKKICGPIWSRSDKMIKEAAAGFARGVVIDTATEDWELLRLGSFGTVTPKGRTDRLYGPVNARFRTHLRQVYRTYGKHLITITQLKDEYKDKMVNGQIQSMKTGGHVPVGFKELGFLCDMRIRVTRSGSDFSGVIELCKLPPMGPSLEGIQLEEDELDFASIVARATDTDREDWL